MTGICNWKPLDSSESMKICYPIDSQDVPWIFVSFLVGSTCSTDGV